MANLRLTRVAGTVTAPEPRLRLTRAAGVVGVPSGSLRLTRVAGVVTVPQPTATIAVTVDPPVPVLVWQTVTLTASASLTGGDTVTAWSWVPVSDNAAPLSVTDTAATTLRILPSLTATVYQYQVTVTTSSGKVKTAVVTVPVPAAPMFTLDADGAQHPAAFIGAAPTYPLPEPVEPPGTATIRLTRVAGVVQSSTTSPTPKVTMLLGARCNFPDGEPGTDNTEAGDFAHGEDKLGPLQITLDYFGAENLPVTYKSPFPAGVRVLLSMSNDVDLTQKNFTTFVKSLPSGTLLTYQHEPERPQFGWTGTQYATKLNDFRDKVRAVRTDCPVGIKSAAYQYRTGSPNYDGVKTGQYLKTLTVDWYAIDTYRSGVNNNAQGAGLTDIPDRNEFKLWKSFVPAGKPWGIGESGFGRVGEDGLIPDIVAQREAHTKSSVEALQAAGCAFFVYFCSSEGPDGHFWLPTGEPGFCAMYKKLARGSGKNPLDG